MPVSKWIYFTILSVCLSVCLSIDIYVWKISFWKERCKHVEIKYIYNYTNTNIVQMLPALLCYFLL